MSDADEVVDQVQTVLARLQRLDLWPPWDAVRTVVEAVQQLWAITSRPPAPAPEDLEDAGDGWHRIGLHWEQAADDVRRTRTRASEPGVWEGDGGQVLYSSLGVLADRVDTVDEAAFKIENALYGCSQGMALARERWACGRQDLRDLRSFGPSDLPLNPVDAVDKLIRKVAAAVRAGRELVGAYQDGQDVVRTARSTVKGWIDTIDLPTVLVPGVSAVDQVNMCGGGTGNDTGPLRGSVAWRALAALAAMDPDQRAAAQALIDGAPDETRRGWVLAAVAAGMTGGPLDRATRSCP
ncbi:MAG: hypothetical protein FWH11_15340 [Micrococcales bacterium]|nr:hypothetical protein [Micrococcales bacterium]